MPDPAENGESNKIDVDNFLSYGGQTGNTENQVFTERTNQFRLDSTGKSSGL